MQFQDLLKYIIWIGNYNITSLKYPFEDSS